MSVYSTSFALGSTAAPIKYTVPAGKLAVIKGIVGVNTGAVALQVSVDINGVYIYYGTIQGASVLNSGALFVVVGEGKTISCAGGAPMHVSCAGFLFDLLAGRGP